MKLESVEYHEPTYSANIIPSHEDGIFATQSLLKLGTLYKLGRQIALHGISELDAERLNDGKTRYLKRYILQMESGLYVVRTQAELVEELTGKKIGVSNAQIREYAPFPRIRL